MYANQESDKPFTAAIQGVIACLRETGLRLIRFNLDIGTEYSDGWLYTFGAEIIAFDAQTTGGSNAARHADIDCLVQRENSGTWNHCYVQIKAPVRLAPLTMPEQHWIMHVDVSEQHPEPVPTSWPAIG